MPISPASNRKPSSASQTRHMLAERCSTIRACEPCKRRRRLCNGQRPCGHCTDTGMECVYSVVSDHPRSVFTTSNARRLSSGSACETCRRRKTKCDGSTPCAFCASNGLECVNNSERRKRAMVVPLGDNEAMDRIEDRLRRIEKLMTAFTPSPLSQSTSITTASSPSVGEAQAAGTVQFRKLSSPHPPSRPTPVRQHRHSVQGISVAKEQAELLTAYATRKGGMPPDEATTGRSSLGITRRNQPVTMPFSCPNDRYRSLSPVATHPSSPPLSPTLMMRQTSAHANTHPLTSSMLNLTLSPSSSTSSVSNTSSMLPSMTPQPSISTPIAEQTMSPLLSATSSPHSHKNNEWTPHSDTSSEHALGPFNYDGHAPTPPSSRSTSRCMEAEWKSCPMPSLMEQLSKRTFASTALDYPVTQYPIYPLTSPPNQTRTASFTHSDVGQ